MEKIIIRNKQKTTPKCALLHKLVSYTPSVIPLDKKARLERN